MLQSATPKGLICSLALVADPRNRGSYLGLETLMARLRPAAAGLLLDPMFWNPNADHCGPVSAALLEEVLRLLPAGCALWVRITGKSAEQTIHICRQLEAVCRRLDYHGPLAWVDTPLFYHSNRGLPEHYRALLVQSQFELVLDNNPELVRKVATKTKRKNIRTAVLKKLAAEPRIAGLIYQGDLRRATNYQRAVRWRPHFPIYDASESRFLERPSSSGVVSVGANLLPRDWQTIAAASVNLEDSQQAGRFRQLWESGQRLRALQRYYGSEPSRIIPAVLAAWGLLQHRLPPLEPRQQQAVERILAYLPEP